MRLSRRTLSGALTFVVLAIALGSVPAFAQFYDPALNELGLGSDVPRSPRLLGMGSLSLVSPDRYQRLSLWNFAMSPAGAFLEDSASTLDLRAGTGSAQSVHDVFGGPGVREDLAGRANTTQMETFHRDNEGTAYGVVADFNTVSSDVPYSQDVETRTSTSVPEAQPILSGVFPYFGKGKLRYGVRLDFASEGVQSDYKLYVPNPQGQFLSMDGTTLTPPSYFTPDQYTVSREGAGVSAAYPVGKSAMLALGVDAIRDKIAGSSTGDLYSSQQTEGRPYQIGEATLVGHIGRSFEYGINERAWTSQSQENWVFSVSAGTGAIPLAGRGKLLGRQEEGSQFTSRVHWTGGRLELGAQVGAEATRIRLTPPEPDDGTSLNRFLDQIYYREGADTLSVPDSVVANTARENVLSYGVGAAWRMRRGVLGVEWHATRDDNWQTFGGSGPRPLSWDVRSGLEYAWSSVLALRAGYAYSWWDEDDYTANNEYLGETGSVGLGLRPKGATWNFDVGYNLTWIQADYGDPLQHHGSRQQLASVIHWGF